MSTGAFSEKAEGSMESTAIKCDFADSRSLNTGISFSFCAKISIPVGTEQIANLDPEKRSGSRFNIETPSNVADLSPEASKRILRGNSDNSSNLESKASPNLKSKSPWRLMMISFKVS